MAILFYFQLVILFGLLLLFRMLLAKILFHLWPFSGEPESPLAVPQELCWDNWHKIIFIKLFLQAVCLPLEDPLMVLQLLYQVLSKVGILCHF